MYEEFFPNGKLKFRLHFKDGSLVSEDSVFWDNGKLNSLVTYDKGKKEYSNLTYDYSGKLLEAVIYDSLGEFVRVDEIFKRYSEVKIEGFLTTFRKDFRYYEYSNFDTLMEKALTKPTTLYKSWYYDKKSCVESILNPSTREFNVTVKSLNQTLSQTINYTFGEDYSFFSMRSENYLRNLKAVLIGNGSYTYSYRKDSLPQGKVYFLRDFESTDDYVLFHKDKEFTGKVVIENEAKAPKFSIKENSIHIMMPTASFENKLRNDYKKFYSKRKSKYTEYDDILDISLNFDNAVKDIFPFIYKILSNTEYNPYEYNDEYEISPENASRIVKIVGEMKEGKPVGKWLAYDQKGRIRRETNFEKGEREGEEKTFSIAYPKMKPKKAKVGSQEYYFNEIDPNYSANLKNYPLKETYFMSQISHYKLDVQHGENKYFDWEGNINFSGIYKDGYMDGLSIEHNKFITTKSNFKEGLLDGITQTKLTLPGKDSITLFDLNFQNNQLQGESKSYHENGKLAKRGFFLNSEPIDDYEAYDTLGFKYHYVKFLYTFPIEEKIWEENELSVRYLFDWKDSIYFRPNDLVEIPSTYDLLLEYGLMDDYALEQPYYGRPSLIDKTGVKYHVTKYFPDQKIARDGPIEKGKKTGCWYYNNYEGAKLYDIDYFDTILKINDSIKFKSKGIRTDFDSKGNPLVMSYVIEKVENYDCSHTDHYELRQFLTIWQAHDSLHRFNGHVKNYYDDGTLQSQGKMENGLPTGIWMYYTPNGQLNQVGEYVKGKRNGRWLKGDLSKTNYLGDICMNPNLPDLEKRIEYQEKLLDINIRYFKLGKIINSEYYDINMNKK